jgi:hypothetical protein
MAALIVQRGSEAGQKLRWSFLLKSAADDDAEPFLEPVCGLASTAGLQMTANLPCGVRRQLSIEIAVDVMKRVVAVLAHAGSRSDGFGGLPRWRLDDGPVILLPFRLECL